GQGALPLGTKLGRTLRTLFVWVWEGAYSALGIGTVGPLPNPDRMDSKGSAFGGGSRGAKPPGLSSPAITAVAGVSPVSLRMPSGDLVRRGQGLYGGQCHYQETAMPDQPVYQRVLLKLSGEALMGRRD